MSAYVKCLVLAITTFCILDCIQADSNCVNPNKRKGYCINIKECPVLLSVVHKPSSSDEDKRFLSESTCIDGFGDSPFVCCTEDAGFKNLSTSTRLSFDLLPSFEDCGDQPSNSKIYSGQETELDEFPWMALLNYGDAKSPTFLCGGSLINKRYVLTAAHCVVDKHLYNIRLGEYDTSKDVDCIESDCADAVVDVFIEDIIVHPNFNVDSIHRHNDIALIRLKDDIDFTPFISPVCMPSVLGLNRSAVGTNLVAAGWGQTLTAKHNNVKLKISLPVSSKEDCQKAFKRSKTYVLDFQLCAGGKFIEDTCKGDSGGPIMYFKGKWAIEGIVSYSRGCGLENTPGIYTRVVEYEDWITANIES